MAQYLWPTAQMKLATVFASLLTLMLCQWPTVSHAQWDIEAMLATKTDWFAHQCYDRDTPSHKAVTFMAIGNNKLFYFLMYRNRLTGEYEPSAMSDLDHKDGQWKVAGEQGSGGGELVMKEMRRIDFKLMTPQQFAQMMKAEPKEVCKD